MGFQQGGCPLHTTGWWMSQGMRETWGKLSINLGQPDFRLGSFIPPYPFHPSHLKAEIIPIRDNVTPIYSEDTYMLLYEPTGEVHLP